MKSIFRLALCGAAIFAVASPGFAQAVKIDPAISEYEKTSGVSGSLARSAPTPSTT